MCEFMKCLVNHLHFERQWLWLFTLGNQSVRHEGEDLAWQDARIIDSCIWRNLSRIDFEKCVRNERNFELSYPVDFCELPLSNKYTIHHFSSLLNSN